MAKVALLIGVSEYGSGLHPLPGAVRDVEAVQQVLQPLKMGGFDEVKQLWNPNPPVMREAIETLFSGRAQNDLVLLFFSGYLVWDDSRKLYLATAITRKSPRAELIRVSAIPVSFVHDIMSNSACQRQVVILDGCLSRVSAQEITANDYSTLDIKTHLGGEGRRILASVTCSQDSFEPNASSHSVYTRYLVEGIRTGAADLDSDGWISVDELHNYASIRLQTAAPGVKPEFYPFEDKEKILLSKAPIDDPKLKYRKEAESWVSGREISVAGRSSLNNLAESLGLTSEDCSVIEAEVLRPYLEYQEKLQQYQRPLAKAICHNYPLDTQKRDELRGFQQSLGLRDEDVAPIEQRMALKLAYLSANEEDVDELAQTVSHSQPHSVSSGQKTVLQQTTRLLSEEPTHPSSESCESADELAQTVSDSQPHSVSSGQKTVLQQTTRLLSEEPTHPSSESCESANPLAQGDRHSQPHSVSSGQKTVLQQTTRLLPEEPSNPSPVVNLSSSLAGSNTSSSSIYTFPYKFLLALGIGGALVIVALAIGIFTRKPVAPPINPADKALSSSGSSLPSPTAKNSHQEPSPSLAESPKSKDCTIFVNGNLRSEPVWKESNVVESLRDSISVTGKRTNDGWVQVKLSSGQLAWAHSGIISSESEREMEACLARKGKTN